MNGSASRTPHSRGPWIGLLFALWLGLSSGLALAQPVGSLLLQSNSATNVPPPLLPVEGDLLQFLDGSSLHGHLASVDTNRGVAWRHPDAAGVIEFRPANLAWIRFEQALPVTNRVAPDCRFQFNNGDEIPGKLSFLDGDQVEFQTWFGGRLQTSRQKLASLQFSAHGFDVLYEGPNGMEDWKLGRGQAPAWQFRDGSLIARTVGTIGRDFQLPDRSSLSFDLAWSGQFNLMITYYTSALDRFDYTTSSYMFSIGYGYLSLQRIQANLGTAILGQMLLQEMQRKNRMRLEFRASRPDQRIAVLVDGVLLHQWQDPQGFAGAGTGVAFFSQQTGPSVRISNIRLSEWDGRLDADTASVTNSAPMATDQTLLVNRDRAQGTVQSIRDGKVAVQVGSSTLKIPMSRVTQVKLSGGSTNSLPRDPWQIRAYFAHGGTVAFRLEHWTATEITGFNDNFGRFSFDPRSVRQLQFNLERSDHLEEAHEETSDEFWDDHE